MYTISAYSRDTMTIPIPLRPYSRVLAAGGLQLHCYDAGAGQGVPLLLIHGLGDEADTWWHVLPPLAEQRRVIAIDLPGFGRSEGLRHGYTLAALAQSVAALLAALGVGKAILVGSSLGAAVAQRLALARPGLVEQLVLIGGGLPVQPAGPAPQLWPLLLPGLGEGIYTSLRRSQQQAYDTLRPFYHNLDGLPAADQAFLWERVWARVWSSGQRRAFLSTLRWLCIERAATSYRARLAQLAVPTELIWGQHDAISPLATGQALAALLPNARLRVIAGSGHLPQQERPGELMALLRDTWN